MSAPIHDHHEHPHADEDAPKPATDRASLIGHSAQARCLGIAIILVPIWIAVLWVIRS